MLYVIQVDNTNVSGGFPGILGKRAFKFSDFVT